VGESGETFEVKSPATGQVLAVIPKATVEDVKKGHRRCRKGPRENLINAQYSKE
jgi:acyl-CoA reductase-like NAD-dependent aldehyde dehydrogenase